MSPGKGVSAESPRPVSWLRVDGRVAIMGILNVTPDSFSDGGLFLGVDEALDRAQALIDAGADMLDIGGESTRPGATPVLPDEECERVIPVIAALSRFCSVPLSIDTSDPMVMSEAVAAGARFINDVRALTRPDALATAVALDVPVCLMHNVPLSSMIATEPAASDVAAQVKSFLTQRLAACIDAGLDRRKIVIDPGFGFLKTRDEERELLRNLPQLADVAPLLVGMSRKRMAGEPLALAVNERLFTSIALALAAVQGGAKIVRVHDVRETREAVRQWEWVFEPKERVA